MKAPRTKSGKWVYWNCSGEYDQWSVTTSPVVIEDKATYTPAILALYPQTEDGEDVELVDVVVITRDEYDELLQFKSTWNNDLTP